MQTLFIVGNTYDVKHQRMVKLLIVVNFHHGWEIDIKYKRDWTFSHETILKYKIYKVVDSQHLSASRTSK